MDRQRQWVLGELWLASVLELGRVPTVEEYTMQRHSASGGLPGFELAAFAQDLRLSDTERNDPALVTAISAANLVISWDNDLISYPKEAFHGEGKGNMVGVIAHHLNCSPQDAVAEVTAIRDRVMSLFLGLHDKLSRSRNSQVRQFGDLLSHFIRGHLDWSAAIPRYREITDHKTPPPPDLPPITMEWTDTPSDTRMTPVDIAPIAGWWDQLK
ncbi:pentalenene synthase [Streptomyces sp. NL15-2K]|nr:pentalenene synthase [Streptomyces sp. NL15-2K]